LRTEYEVADIYNRNVSAVYRVCFVFMKNKADAEDAVSDTFYRLIKKSPFFHSEEHEKAWLIRTAGNVCKDALKHSSRKAANIEDYAETAVYADSPDPDVIGAVLKLPEKYKAAVYLYYYEGYSGAETASILRKPPSTVRSLLSEARKILKEKLGDDFNEK